MRSVLSAVLLLMLVTLRLPHSSSLAAPLAAAPPLTVNTADDRDDGTCDVSHCSLREAIARANTDPGMDTILFDIPGTDHTILLIDRLPAITDAVLLDGLSEPDFGGSPLIEIDGSRAPSGSDGLTIQGSGTTVRGLVIHSFEGALIRAEGGSGITVENNVLGLNRDGLGTGTVALAGVHLFDSSDNTVRGNVIGANDRGVMIEATSHGSAARNVIAGNRIGVDAAGTQERPNWGYGVDIIGGTDNLVGGTGDAARNVIAANGDAGVYIHGTESLNATGNLVQGNHIGTTADGSRAIEAQQAHGVKIELATGNVIDGNLIAGVYEYGIWLFEAHSNTLRGNRIGMDASGTQPLSLNGVGIFLYNASGNVVGGTESSAGNRIGGNRHGVWVFGRGDPWGSGSTEATGNVFQGNHIEGNAGNGIQLMNFVSGSLIGGTTSGAPNVIAGNGGAGVLVDQYSGDFPGEEPGRGAGNRIAGNAIYGNGAPGIDLDGLVPAEYLVEAGDGSTPNDMGDADEGLNGLQNFPALSAALAGGTATTVEGTLDSAPNTTYVIDFYASSACSASGETYLGAVSVTTDGTGAASFSATVSVSEPGQAITATATDPQGSTSEFSACVTVEAGAPADTDEPANLVVNGSFEGNSSRNHTPDGWTAIRLTGRNGHQCGTAYAGHCSVRFGNGSGAGLTQSVAVDGQAGDVYTLSLWARGDKLNARNATAVLTPVEARVILHYADGTQEVEVIPLPSGSYDWRHFEVEVRGTKPFTRIEVVLKAGRMRGTAWFDDVMLTAK